MKPFEFEFTMVDPDDSNVKLEIKMGGDNVVPGVVYFDDVAVEEVKCTDNPSCSDGNACTADVCDVAKGTCSWTPTTDACASDGDDCTLDQCQAGQCMHTFDSTACDCATDAHCNDDNVCTTDHCNAGTCENTANTATCNDNDPCTPVDVCGAGVCGGTNVCFDCTAGGNLLTNCDFSNGTTGWSDGFFEGAAGTQSVVDGRLVVNITNGGTVNWHVQPIQTGLALVKDVTYVVKFNAMASVARSVDVSVSQVGGSYATYSGLKTFNLTPVMQAFTFEFKMESDPPAEPVRFEFDLGGTAQNATVPNTATFDNVFVGPKP
jgi:carbohydrate binding protein with CBM4/9 domain